MFEKIRKMKNQKGFTLVELIVVLVILAILAAMLVPALTGYIDKANNEKIIATTRQVVMAAQTEVSEAYGKDKLTGKIITIINGAAVTTETADTGITGKAIIELAEVGDVPTTGDDNGKYVLKNGIDEISINYDAKGHVTELKVTQGKKTCTYYEGATNKTNGAYDIGTVTP